MTVVTSTATLSHKFSPETDWPNEDFHTRFTFNGLNQV